jgi:outer membrane murein-binding lipoprotein Lpp
MSHFVRTAVLLAACATAGCISNAEVAQTSAVAAEPSSFYVDMHAAIPAGKDDGNVFEYN